MQAEVTEEMKSRTNSSSLVSALSRGLDRYAITDEDQERAREVIAIAYAQCPRTGTPDFEAVLAERFPADRRTQERMRVAIRAFHAIAAPCLQPDK